METTTQETIETAPTEDPRQCWATPKDAWQWITQTFGPFDLDVCADAHNSKCEYYFAAPGYRPPLDYAMKKVWRGEDALNLQWSLYGLSSLKCWCNPGFSMPWEWLLKAHKEAMERNAHTFVLLPLDTSTEWFDYFLDKAHRIYAPRPRIEFVPKGSIEASKNPKPSALIEFKRDAKPDGMIHVMKPYKPITTRERTKRCLLELPTPQAVNQ